MKQKKGDIKICMTCGSTKDLIKCNSANLTHYECKKCRGQERAEAEWTKVFNRDKFSQPGIKA